MAQTPTNLRVVKMQTTSRNNRYTLRLKGSIITGLKSHAPAVDSCAKQTPLIAAVHS
jgi:hypothetical protein